MGTEKVGYIVTTDVASLSKVDYDEAWLITRAGKDIPGTIRVKALSPEPALFSRYYHEWRTKDPYEWWPLYQQEFLKELETPEKIDAMRKLWTLVMNGKVVALVCFCKDSRYCHRTLVGDFLKEKGVDVFEMEKGRGGYPEVQAVKSILGLVRSM
jgi:uncharacterized protein YeaO (DUF488 family)